MTTEIEKQAIEEMIDGFKGTITERISSPLLFSFSTSWVLINFKFFLILISSNKITYKLKLIDWYFSNYGVTNALVFPLLASLTYVFLYPYVSRPVNKFLLNRKLEVQKDIYLAEGRQLVSEDDLKKIRARTFDEKKVLRDEIISLQEELADARAKIDELMKIKNGIDIESFYVNPEDDEKKNDTDRLSDINEPEINILQTLGESEDSGINSVGEDVLMSVSGVGKVKSKLAIQRLMDMGYITPDYRSGKTKYSLTQDGRELYVQIMPN